MQKTRSILMVVLMLVVALSLSGCTLFGNKDKVEKENNAQVATRGVIAVINEDKDVSTLKGYMDSTFNVNVKLDGILDATISKTYEIKETSNIENLFNALRKLFSNNSLTGKMNLKIEENKIDVFVGSGVSANEVKTVCSYNVEINGNPITSGKITFTMKSNSENNVVITGIEIVINVLNN